MFWLAAGDRDDVMKFWDMRRIMEPSLHLTLPKHLPSSDFLLPTVRRPPAHTLSPPHCLRSMCPFSGICMGKDFLLPMVNHCQHPVHKLYLNLLFSLMCKKCH